MSIRLSIQTVTLVLASSAFAASAAALTLVWRQTCTPPDELVARTVTIVDAAGRPRILLGTNGDVTTESTVAFVQVLNSDLVPAVEMSAVRAGREASTIPRLSISDDKGLVLGSLEALSPGVPHLMMDTVGSRMVCGMSTQDCDTSMLPSSVTPPTAGEPFIYMMSYFTGARMTTITTSPELTVREPR